MIRLFVFLLLASALTGYAFWVYLRAELPVRSGRRLAGLRAATLILILALIFDPPLPWGGVAAFRTRWVLLDASQSMVAGDGAAWTEALDRARALAGDGWTVVTFGDGVAPGDVETAEPGATQTAVAPALLRAAEAGVGEVRVISDLRFHDPVDAVSVLSTSAVPVTFESFGAAVVNAGMASFSVADQGRQGDPVTAEVEIFSEAVQDSLLLEVREEGRLVLAQTLAPPTAGRRGRWEVELPAPLGEGRRRYTAVVRTMGDGFAGDDEAVAYMMAGHKEGGLVVVSLRPDWEARALLPVLAEASGLSAVGYLRVGLDRFSPMGRAMERRPPVDSATVRKAAADAALLVIHGLDAHTDSWGRALAQRNSRALAWPLDAVGGDMVGVRLGLPQAGEWYAAADVPASPLAGDLAGARLQDLPPLNSLLPLASSEGVRAPLLLQLRGLGPGQPALVLTDVGNRRTAVVLASGFWRWAARDGSARDAYRRLWSGVAGWLLSSDPLAITPEVRPVRWVNPVAEAMAWWVPGSLGDTVRLQVMSDSVVVVDTVLAAGEAHTGALPSGTYSFRAEGSSGARGEGRFDVTARSDEMFPLPWVPDVSDGAQQAPTAGRSGGGPLRTHPWPYLLLLAFLSLEWVGRRRVGLR